MGNIGKYVLLGGLGVMVGVLGNIWGIAMWQQVIISVLGLFAGLVIGSFKDTQKTK